MFICGFCKEQTPRGASMRRFVVETRTKVYPAREAANKFREQLIDDPGGTGSEIVRELPACSRCAYERDLLRDVAGAA